MSADVIQAQYEQLEALARRFGKQADSQVALQKRLQLRVERLRSAGWTGRGSDAFYREMDGQVFPAMQRLIVALREAQKVTLQIGFILKQAETEAARPFQNKSGTAIESAVPDPKVAPVHDPSRDRPILFGLFTDKYYYSPAYRTFVGTISPDGIAPGDVKQGRLGDCYFMAALSAVARQHPEVIWNAIKDNGDGTYTVTFYKNGKPLQVTVDSDFPVAQDRSGNATSIPVYAGTGSNKQELWPMIMEKAYAQISERSYAKIEGGFPGDAVELITGKPALKLNTGFASPEQERAVLQNLHDRLNNGEYLTAATRNTGSREDKKYWPSYVIPLHAYSVEKVDVAEGLIYLRNPWGDVYNPQPMTLEDFNKYFDYIATNR